MTTSRYNGTSFTFMEEEKDFGIQLTERQLQLKEQSSRPLETRSNKPPPLLDPKSRGTSTTTKPDQKALLRKVLQKSLAKKNAQLPKKPTTVVASASEPIALPPQATSESYGSFLDVLQKEVAGDHTELWRSFRSLFGKNKQDENDAPAPTKIKFDATTKQLLTEMNLYMKKSTTMECQPETQLVNDKHFNREKQVKTVNGDPLKKCVAKQMTSKDSIPGKRNEEPNEETSVRQLFPTEEWVAFEPLQEATVKPTKGHLNTSVKSTGATKIDIGHTEFVKAPNADKAPVKVPDRMDFYNTAAKPTMADADKAPFKVPDRTDFFNTATTKPTLADADKAPVKVPDRTDFFNTAAKTTMADAAKTTVKVPDRKDFSKTAAKPTIAGATKSTVNVPDRKDFSNTVTKPPIENATKTIVKVPDGNNFSNVVAKPEIADATKTPVKVPDRNDFSNAAGKMAHAPLPFKTPVTLKTIQEDEEASSETSSGRKRRIEGTVTPWYEVKLKSAICDQSQSSIIKTTVPWSSVKLRSDTKQSQVGEACGIQWISIDDSDKVVLPSPKLSPPIVFSPDTKKTAWSSRLAESDREKVKVVLKPVPSFVPPSDENSMPWSSIKLKVASSTRPFQEEVGEPLGNEVSHLPLAKLRPMPKPVQSFVPALPPGDRGNDSGIPWSTIKLKATNNRQEEVMIRESAKEVLMLPPVKPKPAPKPVQSFIPPLLPNDRGDGTSGKPWSVIRLKATSSIDQGSGDEADAGESSVPWSKVKLRSLDPDEHENRKESGEGDSILPFCQMLRKVPSQVVHSRPLAPNVSSPTVGIHEIPSHMDDCGIQVGDEIDLNHLPAKILGFDYASAIELQHKPGMPENHSEAIVVGKATLIITRNIGEGTLSRVTWRISRLKVNSLTLDMAENTAGLALADGSTKRVEFATADACLQFASSFYETNKGKVLDPAAQFKKDREVAAMPQKTHDEISTDQAIGEVLNEEEHQLLERYRAMRKTKAADEALRGTFPEIGNSSTSLVLSCADRSSLSAEDEKVATAYRKMLQLRIPLEAVEHKMKKDGVSESVRQAVLNPTGNTQPQGIGDALSSEDDQVAEPYRKMIKNSVPPEAVKQKMTMDNVDQKIIDAVLSAFSRNDKDPPRSEAPIQTVPSETQLNPEEEAVASTYRKMLKMMIPPDAVKHKMKKDQVDSKIVFAIFPDEAAKTTPKLNETTAHVLTNEEETIAKTYRKMLQMMIPSDAVRHKMTKDNIDEKIVLVVLGPNPDDMKTKVHTNILSQEEEKIADSYRRLLKMMIPPDAVRHKMQKEGISEKIIGIVLGDDSKSVKAITGQSKLPGSNLVALQWTPLSGEELDTGVWRAIKKRKVTTAQPEGSDISKLVQLFQKKSNPKGGQGIFPATDIDAADSKAKLIDINRANNVAISLKAFKEFTHSELASTISHLDPHRLICGERVQFVKDILPTTSEAKSIQNYKGVDSRLVPAELFFKEVANVKRMETKVLVMQTMDTFNENAAQLITNFQVLSRACLQVQKSEKLQDVLEMVLHVGNIMNEGTRTGGASGFKFDSLLKLTQTKSSDGKTTVLDYMVMIFVAKEMRETLNLGDDFPDCQAASRMLISDMIGDVTDMIKALQTCKNELQMLVEEVSERQTGNSAPGTSKVRSSVDPRANMFASIKARYRDDGESDKGSDPKSNQLDSLQGRQDNQLLKPKKSGVARNKYLAIMDLQNPVSDKGSNPGTIELAKKGIDKVGTIGDISGNLFDALSHCTNPALSAIASSDDDETKESEQPVESTLPEIKEGTLSSGMDRLEQFITEAENILLSLTEEKNNSLKACKDLSKYCGESGGERVTSTLLGILSQFATNLSAAVEKHDNRKLAELRKEAAAKKKPTHGVPLNCTKNNRLRTDDIANDESSGLIQSESLDFSPGRQSFENSKSAKNMLPVSKRSISSAVNPADLSPATPETHSDGTQGIVNGQTDKATTLSLPKPGVDGQSLVLMVNKMLKAAPSNVKEDFVKGIVYNNPADPNLHRIYQKEQSLSCFSPPRPTQLDIMSAIKKRRERAERLSER